jgi:hypothetical protein
LRATWPGAAGRPKIAATDWETAKRGVGHTRTRTTRQHDSANRSTAPAPSLAQLAVVWSGRRGDGDESHRDACSCSQRETCQHTGARATATHPLELVWSWQSLKPLMTLGLVHAGGLTVTRGMQGLLPAPCQTISATRAKFRQGVRNRRKRQNGTRTCVQTGARRPSLSSPPERT